MPSEQDVPGSNPGAPAIAIQKDYTLSLLKKCLMMWPYEEYTLLENILVLLIPYLFMVIAYFLLKPFLERRIAEKTADSNSTGEGENDEYW